jgi:antitoxin CcdA
MGDGEKASSSGAANCMRRFMRVYFEKLVWTMLAKAETKKREAANMSINAALLADARALDINVSRAAEMGIAEAVKAEKGRRWREENREALESSNAWVEQHGLPLAKYRQF